MDPLDVVAWLVVGIVSGSLVATGRQGASPAGQLSIAAAGAIAALAGGWIAEIRFEMTALAFLGAVCVGMVGAIVLRGVLAHLHPTRSYHT
jgi:hypothetical protein